jgi:hypothetical protein
MMMETTYQADGYSPDLVRARYVRAANGSYRFCEVGDDRRYDLRQGIVEPSELSMAVRRKACALEGHAYGWVTWP